MPVDVWQIVLALIGAGAIYGGIRADLRALHVSVQRAQSSADKAHERIDGCMGGGHG